MKMPPLSVRQGVLLMLSLLACCFLLDPRSVFAQRNAPPPVAQVGPGFPLPVYVTNTPNPPLPGEFLPGTSWKFTSWTVPSSLSFTVSVEKTEGGWALLKLNGAEEKAKWYFVAQMPGAWEQLP